MAVARAAAAFAWQPPPPAVPAPSAPAADVVPDVLRDDPAPVTPTAQIPPPTVPLQAPVAAVTAPAAPLIVRTRRHVRWGRSIVLGVVAGVLLTAGALTYEAVWIRYLPDPPDAIAMTEASYEEIGCTVSYPVGWRVTETKRRVTFLSGEAVKDRSTRGFRVSETDIPFARVNDQIEQLPDRLVSYAALETFADSVDGEPATVHVFVADDLRFEQWWVERGKRTLRVDMWSRPADEDARELNERIVDEIELL